MVSYRPPNPVEKANTAWIPRANSPLENTPHKAGVVRDDLMAAANALVAMSAERGSAATFDGPKHFELCPRQRTAIAFDEPASCPADDVGHLPGRPCHSFSPLGGCFDSGRLGTAI